MSAPLLAVAGVGRAFPGVQALQDVQLQVRQGEVLAVIGENGAGKSTLMKILAGVLRPDAGTIRWQGEPVALAGPALANALGIALIHQELSLCDNLTVAGALFLGAELRRGPFLRLAAMRQAAAVALRRVGLDVDPDTRVGALAPGQRQLVEIARALRLGARLLIMDEPTSSLTHAETARLFAVVRDLRAGGTAVIYISHRLGEVRELADRVLALRDGRNAGELAGAEATHDRMVAMMVGRALPPAVATGRSPGAVVLAVRGLRTAAFPAVANDLQVRAGEIVGIAGLLGSGRSELLQALFGALPARGGEVRIDSVLRPIRSPRQAMAAGLALVPEDRKQQGLLLDWSVRRNVGLAALRGLLLDRARERELAATAIAGLRIATPNAEQPVGALSGGNQQKVVLGKWLATRPRVLLLDEPTRGVDVGARQEIYRQLHELAARGLGVLFVSSELEEVLALADRVLVMAHGRIRGELDRGAASEQAIMQLMTPEAVA